MTPETKTTATAAKKAERKLPEFKPYDLVLVDEQGGQKGLFVVGEVSEQGSILVWSVLAPRGFRSLTHAYLTVEPDAIVAHYPAAAVMV